eukprot:CAMPEP_0201580312 /NCGR_PEP_ID=MMETSP0190_2-20130828/42790_1 /ASSEMBLY_ACC=CAM_ASM_000263 /TAXON_ID=37353 /ORGANISM="Rosalina sp." /LENGTH=186 /DNA_ID=CAMNT_0048016125 /DNA_START=55 /DNA_END=612 /DNA_ORIENTATION=-
MAAQGGQMNNLMNTMQQPNMMQQPNQALNQNAMPQMGGGLGGQNVLGGGLGGLGGGANMGMNPMQNLNQNVMAQMGNNNNNNNTMGGGGGANKVNKGRCKKFDTSKGFGFITMDDGSGDIFVHYSEIQAQGFKSLAEGEAVEFQIVQQDDGRRKAINVTGPNGTNVQGQKRMPQNNFGGGGGGGGY